MAQRKVNVALKSVGPRVTKTGWDALDATDLPDTAVTPGSYTNADITVDAQGRVTAAANGTIPPGYTDEQAQDAVGAMAANSARVTLTYVDATPSLTADLVIDSINHTYLHATGSPMLLGRSFGGAGQVNEEYCSPLAFSLIAQTSTTAMQGTLGLGSACTLAADTDGTLAANSDTKVATQKAVKTYVDNAVVGLLDFKGSTDCSANPNYPAALKGDAYMVSVAGKIGGASGLVVTPGDLFFAIADNVGGTQAAVGASWNVLEYNVTGALMAANNLSDLTNVATARSNLGLVIGTNVQAYDATLAALAGYNTNGFLVQIAPDTFLARNITGTTNEITVTNGGGLAGDTVISLPADVLIPTVLTCKNTGMHIIDAGNAFDLIVKPGSTYTADRTLTITTGDANRTLTLAGDATVTGTNTGDQTITLTGDVTGSGTGSFAASIGADKVTTAKILDANVTAPKLGPLSGLTAADPYFSDELAGYDLSATANRKFQVDRLMGLLRVHPGGRLTLTAGAPVTTADVTGATGFYYTPHASDVIVLWDGTRWVAGTFTETVLALGTLTANKNYDVFGFLSGSTLALESLAWTSDSARATAVTVQDGRWCKSGDKTRLYLGTFRTTSTTTTEDSRAKRFVWNAYNRVRRPLRRYDSSSVYSYTTAAWRVANGLTANKVEWVTGLDGDAVDLSHRVLAVGTSAVGFFGLGIDTTAGGTVSVPLYFGGTAFNMTQMAAYSDALAVGYHYAQMMEYGGTGIQFDPSHAGSGVWGTVMG